MFKPIVVVLTGAPASGKSSLLKEALNRYVGKIVTVPEVPSIFLNNGIETSSWPTIVKNDLVNGSFSKTIISTRKRLEDSFIEVANYHSCHVLCDRGVLDVAAYLDVKLYNSISDSSIESDYQRYDYVIHMGSSIAAGILEIQTRLTDMDFEESKINERNLAKVWQLHPNYSFIPAYESLEIKFQKVFAQLDSIFSVNQKEQQSDAIS